jgi:lipoyl(octanoyl) transferase
VDDLVFTHVGFGDHAVDYHECWELQRTTHERRVRDEIPDTVLLLEHQPVYTAGKRTEPLDRPLTDPGAPVIDVDRGGKITWHGPGQLVGYPIVKLGDPVDVVAYVRRIEEALIRACADIGLRTHRVEGRSGVWTSPAPVADSTAASPAQVRDAKVGAVGIRVARGVTMHGFALNCDNDLSWFDRIVPCGIRDASVTSLSEQAGRHVPVAEMVARMEQRLAEVMEVSATYHRGRQHLRSGPSLTAAS